MTIRNVNVTQAGSKLVLTIDLNAQGQMSEKGNLVIANATWDTLNFQLHGHAVKLSLSLIEDLTSTPKSAKGKGASTAVPVTQDPAFLALQAQQQETSAALASIAQTQAMLVAHLQGKPAAPAPVAPAAKNGNGKPASANPFGLTRVAPK